MKEQNLTQNCMEAELLKDVTKLMSAGCERPASLIASGTDVI